MSNKHGSNWIRKDRRLAIYLRDGMACAFCGNTIEDGAMLSLDHIETRSNGGGHETENLVTACRKCNSSRGDRDLQEFCQSVADYVDHGVTGQDIYDGIQELVSRPIKEYRDEARKLMSRRPTWQQALELATKECDG